MDILLKEKNSQGFTNYMYVYIAGHKKKEATSNKCVSMYMVQATITIGFTL